MVGLALFHWFGAAVWLVWVSRVVFVIAGYALFMCGYMLFGSLVVKVRGREKLLNLIPWSGREHVLDVGCGRGLLLVGAARRLTTGKAVGVDLWIQKDQSSNKMEAALIKAAVENVSDRVQVETGDMCQLPFADASFDVVVSSWAVHNLEHEQERSVALSEMVRVLKPGGSVLLNDIANRAQYEAQFKALGMLNVRRVAESRVSDFFSGAVSFGTFQPATVAARKPEVISAP